MKTLRSPLELEVSRIFKAPRHLVFDAHTKAEHVKRWWGPRESELTTCEMDVRPGGAWHYVLRTSQGRDYSFRGQYHEIVPPERLVQTFAFDGLPGAVTTETLTFIEDDDTTIVTAVTTFRSTEERDRIMRSGMEAGAAEVYDRLEVLLTDLTARHEKG